MTGVTIGVALVQSDVLFVSCGGTTGWAASIQLMAAGIGAGKLPILLR